MSEETYCPRHPGVATALRCSKCGQLICPKCMVESPTGQRCRDCAQGPRLPIYDVPWYLYVVTIPVAVAAGLVAGMVSRGFGFFVFFIAPTIGGLVGQAVFLVARRKRGTGLALIAAGGVVLGGILSPLLFLLPSLAHTGIKASGFVSLVSGSLLNPFLILYLCLAASAAYWRLR